MTSDEIHYPVTKAASAIATASAATGMTLADAAAIATLVAGVLASIISLLVLGEMVWKKMLKPLFIWAGWMKPKVRSTNTREGDK